MQPGEVAMGFPVICISETDGSGGATIGRDVAKKLGFRYIDEQIIVEAARLAGVAPEVVAAAEHKQSLLDRILDSMASAQDSLGTAALASGIALPVTPDISYRRTDREELRTLIRIAVMEVARGGRAVIYAHAASHALAARPGVLRVLVTAPDTIRAKRLETERNLSSEDAAEAVEDGDAGRRDYLRSFYEVDEELPTLYDLVLNTEHLTAPQAAATIVAAATAAD
jgi:cytidylate kinase